MIQNLLLFVLLFHSIAVAADLRSDIDIDVVVGFRGVIKLERWIPLVITLENRGPSLQGTLIWEVHGGREYLGEEYLTTYSRQIDLPHNSKKRFKTVVFLNSYNTPLVFRFEREGKIIAHREVTIPHHPPLERLILGLSQGFPLDFFSVAPERRTQVVYPRLEDLPDQVQGYESVDAVVVHQISLRSLTAPQMQALQKWVAVGGVLIFSSGAHYSLYQDPYISSFLPVEIQGLVELHSLQTLEKKYETPIATPQPFVVTRVVPRPETLYIQEGEVPLVVEQKVGKGKIVFLTFDFAQYPFNTWKKKLLFWKDLLQSDASSEMEMLYQGMRSRWETDLVNTTEQLPILNFPSHYLLALFLAVYLLAMGYLFWCLGEGRAQRKNIWKWGSGIILLFTLLAAWFLQEAHLEQDAMLLQITAVESLPKSDFATVESQVALFSTVHKSYDVTFLGEEIALTLGTTSPREGQRPKEFEIAEGEGYTVVKNIAIPRWGLRTLQAKSVIRFPLDFTISEDKGIIHLSLTNHTEQTLTDNWLWYRGTFFPLGEWKAKATIQKEIPTPLAVPDERFLFNRWQQEVANQLGRDQQETTQLIRKAAMETFFKKEKREEIFQKDRFLLVGWVEDRIPKIRVEDQGSSYEGVTMVKLSFP